MFKKGDVICFFGDSITANGLWIAEVYQNVRKICPVKCYNVGVAGATAERASLYLHKKCLSLNPDWVVMMFGINDIRYSLYSEGLKNDEQTESLKKAALLSHKSAYEYLVKETVDSGAKVILATPTPYDDVNEKEEENLRCQSGLDECVVYLKKLAEKYNCHVVDFKTVMQPMLSERDILSKDRIHPTPIGHHVMAQIFLNDVGIKANPDFDSPFVWDEWNRERYDAEQELTLVNFIEYNVLLKEGYKDMLSYEARKKIAEERYEEYEDKTGFFPRAYKEYLDKIDRYEQYTADIIKRTIL